MTDQAIRKVLADTAAISSVVGDRIRIDKLHEEDIYPAIIIEVNNRERKSHKDVGVYAVVSELDIICISSDGYQKEAKDLIEIINGALDDYSGVVEVETGVFVDVNRCYWIESYHDYEQKGNYHKWVVTYKVRVNK